MDREPEELQFMGFLGIYSSSTKLLFHHRRLFSQILTTLILPLSLLFLAHVSISHLLFSQIHHNEDALQHSTPDSPTQSHLLSLLSSEWSLFFLFKAAYLLFLLIFALLSTSAVVYTIASIFASKDVSFAKIFTVLPKVWKRLMITFICAFALMFSYNVAFIIVIVTIFLLFDVGTVGVALLIVVGVLYFIGLVYVSVVWHIASVVSVLEDYRGIAAMKKSRELVKGKIGVAVGIFLKLNVLFVGIEIGFKKLVVEGGVLGVGGRVGVGIVMLGLLCLVILFGLVVQTVVYLVCKSYHHESIDKSSLADHLEVYMGEYEPLKGRDVQLEQYYV